MQSPWPRWGRGLGRGAVISVVLAFVGSACTLTSTLGDLTAGDQSGGAAGAAAAGGSSASGGSAGSTGATGGSSGSGGGNTDASVASCTDDTKNGDETDVDCGGSCPTKCADDDTCALDADCSSGFCRPTDNTCQAPSCTDTFQNQDETDVDCGGTCGATCEVSEGCASDDDCVSTFCRPTDNTCQTPSCTDTFQNQDETDVDCGGSCPPCMNGEGCGVHADCTSGYCQPTDSTCRPAECMDGAKNQDETDVDCGGTCGATCDDGEDCGDSGDCLNGFCRPTDSTCRTPTCSDMFQNQDETDVDCGGTCGATCVVGETCAIDGDCVSTFCRPTDMTCRAPTCSDGFQNQGETDVDCGGGNCPPCPTCWGDASNFDFDDSALDFTASVTLSCSPTIDTSQSPGSMITGWCGAQPTPVVQSQTGGPGIVVVPMADFTLASGQTLRLIGDKPVVLAVRGDATINGTIDAGAQGVTPGAGGDDSRNGSLATDGQVGGADCNVFADGTGEGMEDGTRSLGGGGAGMRTNGGFGGGERSNFRCYQGANGYECKTQCPDSACDNSYNNSSSRFVANNSAHYAVAPVHGLQAPDQDLVPLRAGCAGGKGDGAASIYFGGSGGGAVQITAADTLTVGTGGIISAGGGGGRIGGGNDGGSGGGSGGAIFLEATVIDLAGAAGVRAHGGSGAGRDCASTAQNGHLADDVYATHPGCNSFGRGGLSYWNLGSSACNGSGGSIGTQAACTLPLAQWPTNNTAYPTGGNFTDNDGGGGGGGSGGLIRVRLLVLGGACS